MEGVRMGNLPTSFSPWKMYFDKTYDMIRKTVQNISYGRYKYDLIITHLQLFKNNFIRNHEKCPNVSQNEGKYLLEFFKVCASLIACSYDYLPSKFLAYFLSHSIDKQYKDLALLWKAWNCVTISLNMPRIDGIDIFAECGALERAHFLDLKALYESLVVKVDALRSPYKEAVQKKLDDIVWVLRKMPDRAENPSNGIINRNQFTTDQELGKGAYAVVKLATMNSDGRKVAVKELKQVQFNQRNILSLKRELNALLRLKHPNVLEFIGVTITRPFSIATAYCANGSLFDTLHKHPEVLDPTRRMKLMIGVARGLEYLAAMQFIHRDVKSQNVLLDDEYNAVVCDFGITRTISTKMTYELGTAQWTAPEILKVTQKPYDYSVDTYSYAVVMWELLTGKVPHYGMRVTQVACRVLEEGLRPPIPEGTNEALANLITRCWAQNPQDRPKMTEVRKELEKAEAVLHDTNVDELKKWVQDTVEEHENIMREANERTEKNKARAIEHLHTINNALDPSLLVILKQLIDMKCQFSYQLLNDLLKFIGQDISIPVQEAAFDLLKEILKPDSFNEEDEIEIIEKLLDLPEEQSFYAVEAIKIMAVKITDPENMINRLLTRRQRHTIVELLEAIITPNKDKVSLDIVIKVMNVLQDSRHVGPFFRFAVTTFKPRIEFLPIALSSAKCMYDYVHELSLECDSNVESVKQMLGLEEFMEMDKESLRQILQSISFIMINPKYTDITEAIGILVYKFFVKRCMEEEIKRGVKENPDLDITTEILPLINIVARVPSLHEQLIHDDIWTYVIKAVNMQCASTSHITNALDIIGLLPTCPIEEQRIELWNQLVDLYKIVKDSSTVDVIGQLLDRRRTEEISKCYNVDVLRQIVRRDISSPDEYLSRLAITVAKHFDNDSLDALCDETLWSDLSGKLNEQNDSLCIAIGELLVEMIDNMLEFPHNPDFYAAVLTFLYEMDNEKHNSFSIALPFILFLTKACKTKSVLVFLYKRYFADYIEQLLWRYRRDSRVMDVIEFCATTLVEAHVTV